MKKIILVFAVMCAFQVSAQDAELEAFKNLFNSEKKTVLVEFLDLDATKAMAFNEIYDDYLVEQKTIANSRIALVEQYVDEYETLTDDQADALVSETFTVRAKSDKLQKKYYKKFKKALGAKSASKFVQFERYVQTTIDSGVQEALPLIGDN